MSKAKCLLGVLRSFLPSLVWNKGSECACDCADCKCKGRRFFGLKWEKSAIGICREACCDSKEGCCKEEKSEESEGCCGGSCDK